MPKIVILDTILVADSLSYALSSAEGIGSLGATDSLAELEALIARERPDVIVVDIAHDSAAERVKVCELPRVQSGEVPVLFLSRQPDAAMLEAVQRCGSGFLLKATPVQTVVGAIGIIAAGGTVLDGRVVSTTAENGSPVPSEREMALLHFLGQGLTNVELAHQLGISPRTVESHLRRLFARYGVTSRTQLLMLALREGWINPSQ